MVPLAPRLPGLTRVDPAPPVRPRPIDAAGSVGVAALGALTLWVAGTTVADRGPTAAIVPYLLPAGVLVAGFGLGRALARDRTVIGITAVLALGVAVIVGAVASGQGATAGPMGYANANGALAVQVTALAGIIGLGDPRRSGPADAATVTGALAATASGSVSATLLVGGVTAVVLLLRVRPVERVGAGLLASASALVIAVVAGLWLASLAVWPPPITSALSARRHELWTDARSLIASSPITGHGAGSLHELSDAARDADTATAHSVVLQIGAEAGLIGAVLLGVVAVAGIATLRQGRPAAAVLGAAAWAAFWIHAQIDYVYASPTVVLATGAVVGAATAWTSEELDVTEREGPGVRLRWRGR